MNFSDKIKFQREQNHLTQKELAELALNWEQVNGIVINPFGKYIQMTKKMIELLINGYEYNENERKSKDDENN